MASVSNSRYFGLCLSDSSTPLPKEHVVEYTQVALHWQAFSTSLTFTVLAVAEVLFGLYRSERRNELFTYSYVSPPPFLLSFVPNDDKRHKKKKGGWLDEGTGV